MFCGSHSVPGHRIPSLSVSTELAGDRGTHKESGGLWEVNLFIRSLTK